MNQPGEPKNKPASIGLRLRCPRCGYFTVPKDENLVRSMLQQSFQVGTKCAHCGCEFMYDRDKGEVQPLGTVIDATPLLLAFALRETIPNAVRQGDWERVKELMQQHEDAYRASKGPGLWEQTLQWHGGLYLEADRLDLALEKFRQVEAVCRSSGDHAELANSFRCQARVARRQRRLDDAERLAREAIQLFQKVGDERAVCATKGDLALTVEGQGDPAAALELHRESEQLARRLGEMEPLQNSLGNQAAILADMGQVEQAVQLLTEQEKICRESSNQRGTAQVMVNQGILTIRGLHQLREGMRRLADGCRECVRQQVQPSLQQALLVMKTATAELVLPITKSEQPQPDDQTLDTIEECLEFGLEFKESKVVVWSAQALVRGYVFRGESPVASRRLDTILQACRQQQWTEPLLELTELDAQLRKFLRQAGSAASPAPEPETKVSLRLKTPESFAAGAWHQYTVIHPDGLEAGACAQMVKVLMKLPGDIEIEKEGETTSGKSIMGLMMLAAAQGSAIKIKFSQPQAGHVLGPLVQEQIIAPAGTQAFYRCPNCAREIPVVAADLAAFHVCPGCGQRNRLGFGKDSSSGQAAVNRH
jgi:phosphocarrier protein